MGANPHLANSGWSDQWGLPRGVADLRAGLRSCGVGSTWTDTAGANENLPINCISWLELFAFCAWEKKRLPTFVERQYAASGGSKLAYLPWSINLADRAVSEERAVYDWGSTAPRMPSEVIMKPAGQGVWGQLDLAGNVAEWTLDRFPPTPEFINAPCQDCADLAERTPDLRVVTGGSFVSTTAAELANSTLSGQAPDYRDVTIGGRCAASLVQ